MITKIIYGIFIKPITLLPFSILFKISDFLYFVLYRILKYRTSVVRTNLKNSFPEKSHDEIIEIEKEFYVHLCDLIVESFKVYSIKEDEFFQHIEYDDNGLIDKYKDRNLCVIGTHFNNFEFAATSATKAVGREVHALFSKLSNDFFNKRMKESRSQFGTVFIEKNEAKEFFSEKHEKPFAVIFGADQSPTYSKNVIWTDFLNQETACFFGPEKYAKEHNMVVIFTKTIKVKRGYYKLTFDVVTEDPLNEPHGAITERHNRFLEKVIQENPPYWLWTHKRWKRKRNENEEVLPASF
ncbi:lysophospholipid acyltransferase family protein [Flammeovirga yaeyamensis]|uniref:Lysophospholipid acyltransferase family protein n=1 Tax=Flammeovirga yaeyamensis TaxID=367791 RepID=A0AAX1MZ84_9BACT|nr:lysophospholipid acyltransferase family protein [Flammeovirga yaeyamensis]MBB3700884.1 KDO2-lipid IV(A) lauroyltransferase [Flammeovirga yaeyamensis]NMF37992.1 lysophospholipid acyltransferase family protein [Flammeovirga yaeyamensis]QWG00643.1 lysophospholipid acyltransferase family protein [Flammeovirga yaeyamensis]